jgi:Ca2+-binding EF-hand superfamily protein
MDIFDDLHQLVIEETDIDGLLVSKQADSSPFPDLDLDRPQSLPSKRHTHQYDDNYDTNPWRGFTAPINEMKHAATYDDDNDIYDDRYGLRAYGGNQRDIIDNDEIEESKDWDLTSASPEDRLAYEIFSSASSSLGEQLFDDLRNHLLSAADHLGGYISISEISQILANLGLVSLSLSDIVYLAKGFSSDGYGNIAAEEIIDAVRGGLRQLQQKHEQHRLDELKRKKIAVKASSVLRPDDLLMDLSADSLSLIGEIAQGFLKSHKSRGGDYRSSIQIEENIWIPFLNLDRNYDRRLAPSLFLQACKVIFTGHRPTIRLTSRYF